MLSVAAAPLFTLFLKAPESACLFKAHPRAVIGEA